MRWRITRKTGKPALCAFNVETLRKLKARIYVAAGSGLNNQKNQKSKRRVGKLAFFVVYNIGSRQKSFRESRKQSFPLHNLNDCIEL
jgi:hypothetical protein